MRRVLEFLLLTGGAFGFALGLELFQYPWYDPIRVGVVVALSWAALTLGAILVLRPGRRRTGRPAAASDPHLQRAPRGPLGVVHLAWSGDSPPRIIGTDDVIAVSADHDGTVRLRLRGKPANEALICRSGPSDPVYFNTLKRDDEHVAIKLFGPIPPVVRLEVWDRDSLT